jgi:hypothetical protein
MNLVGDLSTSQEKAGNEGRERRRGLRIRQNRPVKVFEPLGQRYYPGQTQDISATGLRLALPPWASVREGTELAVHVGVASGGQKLANRRQMIPAKVVWVGPEVAGRTTWLTVGVEFVSSVVAHLDAA